MKSYLLDTNICIFYMGGKFNLSEYFDRIPNENLFVSEITLAELKFGVEHSAQIERNRLALNKFLTGVQLLPIAKAVDFFAREKSRLRKAGTTIDDFDLLIGSTAVAHQMVLVTNNTAHLGRIQGIMAEDWTKIAPEIER